MPKGWCEARFIFSTPYYGVPHKTVCNKLKLRLKNTIIDKVLTYASETWILTKRDRKQLNIFERTVYRKILGPVHDNEKENWRTFTTKEIYAIVKKPTITETIRLNRLCWFGHVQRMEENRIPKRVLHMNLEITRPRNRRQDEVREDGRIICGEGWQKKVYNREEWKKILRTATNCHILHMPIEWMNEWMNIKFSHLGDQVPWISARLTYSSLTNKMSLLFQVHTIHTSVATCKQDGSVCQKL